MTLEGSVSTFVSDLDGIDWRFQRGAVGCFFVSAPFKCRARSDGSGAYNYNGKWAAKARCIRNLVISWYETPPKHPLCMQKNPLSIHITPSVWEFPWNSHERAVFEAGIPIGIPAIPDLGNSRCGNSK